MVFQFLLKNRIAEAAMQTACFAKACWLQAHAKEIWFQLSVTLSRGQNLSDERYLRRRLVCCLSGLPVLGCPSEVRSGTLQQHSQSTEGINPAAAITHCSSENVTRTDQNQVQALHEINLVAQA